MKQQEKIEDASKRLNFARSDFLPFCPQTARTEGNKKLCDHVLSEDGTPGDSEREGMSQDEVDLAKELWKINQEAKGEWMKYRNREETEITGPKDERCVKLLSWLVSTFGLRLCLSRTEECEKYESDEAKDRAILKTLTPDDFTFIFVQVQQNITKWNLFYHAHKKKMIEGWKEQPDICQCETDKKSAGEDRTKDRQLLDQMDRLGCEFPTGAGVGGAEGRRRYTDITKFLVRNYFDTRVYPEKIEENKELLQKAVVELGESRRTLLEDELGMDRDRHTNGPKKKKQRRETAPDPEYNDFASHILFSGLGNVGVVAV